MKKLLAITLAFVLVLSLSAVAFAAASPVKTVTAKDLPEESAVVKEAAVTSGDAKIVALKDMTAAQKAEANKAISAVVKEGALPTDVFAVDTEDEAVVAVKLDENVVVYVFFADGKVMKYAAKDLTVREDGTYEIPVKGYSYIVVAVEA